MFSTQAVRLEHQLKRLGRLPPEGLAVPASGDDPIN
jgi:hypothetical protein